ncbi:MAG: nuclear transport factor 2 family protein [Bacillota bacterium]|jgi:ketosteroid isomerase-like protein
MSKNLAIIKESYAAGANNDILGMLKDLAEEGIWIETAGGPYGGTYVGKDSILKDVFGRIKNDWETFICIPEDFYDAGNTVIMTGWYKGINLQTKKEFKTRVAHVWQLSGDQIIKFEQFMDSATLLEAMKN